MSIEEVKEFCAEHINGLPQQGREEIFDILRLYVDDSCIDSSNSDGSRVYQHMIPDECFHKMYRAIKTWLEE